MKNKEKYFDEIVEAFLDGDCCLFAGEKVQFNCDDYPDCNTCVERIKQWLNQEYHEPLKPCPFCGGKATVSDLGEIECPEYFAYCVDEYGECEVNVKTCGCTTEQEAIEVWNRRAK